MGLQKPSNPYVVAGKATVHSVDYEDDVEASAATGFGDGDDEQITVSLPKSFKSWARKG